MSEAGTSYGAEENFTTQESVPSGEPCPGLPTFTDPRDGQIYPTVQIGDQCWLQKNLNYNDPNSKCYNDNPSNCNTYGRLYTWTTAIIVCPESWPLPSDAEWKILEGNADSQFGAGDPEWNGWQWRGFNSDQYSVAEAFGRVLSYSENGVYRFRAQKPEGRSVRCLKD
ncbi:MAG: hypothetical protein JXA23_06710 [Bacteroidales bacterium]|nr:hypothetical protein [Bacteroidales bacterium]